MPGPNLQREFLEKGYLVAPSIFTAEQSAVLLREVVKNMPLPKVTTSTGEYIKMSDYRIHSPLRLAPDVRHAVSTCVQYGYEVMDSFLERRKLMVELSAITVFPGAQAQDIHADEMDLEKHIISIFINLAPTVKGVGALQVIPGSHTPTYVHGTGTPEIVELPTGSAIFMNGKLRHGGTENTSTDRIRPVLYFSFGDDDIEGPAYSILSEYLKKWQLADFKINPLDRKSRPKFRDGYWPALDLNAAAGRLGILVMQGSMVVAKVLPFDQDDDWPVGLTHQLCRGGATVEELERDLNIETVKLYAALNDLNKLGFISW